MRTKLITMAIAAVAIVAPAGIASAAPEIAVSPSSVDAAGEQEVEVTLSGFTAETPVFVLPCAFPAGGDVAAFDNTTCDQAQLSPAVIDAEGGATVTATFDIPAEGIAIYVTDAAQAESGVALITIGEAAAEEAPAEEAEEAEEAPAEEAPAEEPAADPAEGDGTPAPTAVNTGAPVSDSSNAPILALALGMMVLAGGALTLRHAKN